MRYDCDESHSSVTILKMGSILCAHILCVLHAASASPFCFCYDVHNVKLFSTAREQETKNELKSKNRKSYVIVLDLSR